MYFGVNVCIPNPSGQDIDLHPDGILFDQNGGIVKCSVQGKQKIHKLPFENPFSCCGIMTSFLLGYMFHVDILQYLKMFVFKVSITQDDNNNILIVKYVSGQDVTQIDHVSFLQLIYDYFGQTGSYVHTIQIYFPNIDLAPIDSQEQVKNFIEKRGKVLKVGQVFNKKRLYDNKMITIVQNAIKQYQTTRFK